VYCSGRNMTYMHIVLQWQRFREGRCVWPLGRTPFVLRCVGKLSCLEIFVVLQLLNFEIIHWNRLRSHMLPDSLFTTILLCYFPVLLVSWTVDASCKIMLPMKRCTLFATLLSTLSLIVNRNCSALISMIQNFSVYLLVYICMYVCVCVCVCVCLLHKWTCTKNCFACFRNYCCYVYDSNYVYSVVKHQIDVYGLAKATCLHRIRPVIYARYNFGPEYIREFIPDTTSHVQ